jgi:hypothetical protein
MCLLFHNSPWRGLSHGRRSGRLRSRQNSAALRFNAHIHRPYCVDVHIRCSSSVAAAGDYVRAKTPLRSVLTLTSIAPTALTSTSIVVARSLHGSRSVVAAGDYVRAKTPLRSVLTLTSIAPTALTSTSGVVARSSHGRRTVVAQSSLSRRSGRLRSPKLRCAPTRIPPTHAAIASVAKLLIWKADLRNLYSVSLQQNNISSWRAKNLPKG